MNVNFKPLFASFDPENPTVHGVLSAWQGEIFEDEFGNWYPQVSVWEAAKSFGVNIEKLNANFEELDVHGDIDTNLIDGKFVVRLA